MAKRRRRGSGGRVTAGLCDGCGLPVLRMAGASFVGSPGHGCVFFGHGQCADQFEASVREALPAVEWSHALVHNEEELRVGLEEFRAE